MTTDLSEAFVSDQGTNLYALDLRTGQIAYGYRGIQFFSVSQALVNASISLGISGAVNSLAVAPSFLASVSLDRFTRVHSTFPPASEVGKQQEQKGVVLEKVYMTTTPTVVIWDQNDMGNLRTNAEEDDGDVWEQMKHVGDRDED